jgi:hypothetical protein
MLNVEYNILSNMAGVADVPVSAGDLLNKADRTLLYGFTCDRSTWHVYLKDGEIHTVMYMDKKDIQEIPVTSNNGYLPDKRLYPERCDFEFCSFLKNLGCILPFTTWTDLPMELQKKKFYGETL